MRTVFFGKPPEKFRERYEVVVTAYKEALNLVRPGITFGEVDEVAHRVIDEAGYGPFFPRRLGYSVGLYSEPGLWIEDSLISGNNRVIEPGMVLSIEPGINVLGEGGVKIGDNVVVTKDGFEYLTTPTEFPIEIAQY
jgi:Xaa-Pro aminopeptidase